MTIKYSHACYTLYNFVNDNNISEAWIIKYKCNGPQVSLPALTQEVLQAPS